MTDHDALLRAIGENPQEDTPRLVFADWLEENGQPDRAAFIRTDVAMALRDEWDAERLRWELIEKPRQESEPWARSCLPALPPSHSWSDAPLFERGFWHTIQVERYQKGLGPSPQTEGLPDYIGAVRFTAPHTEPLAGWPDRVSRIEFSPRLQHY